MASEDLKKEIHFALENATLGRTLGNFCKTYPARREKSYAGVDFEKTRKKIAEVKSYAAEHIDEMIAEFTTNCEARGGHVYHAKSTEDAMEWIRQLVKEKGVKTIVKSKSMASEEIKMNHVLTDDDVLVQETDLGEFIIALEGNTPVHMVMPALHLNKEQVADLFTDYTKVKNNPIISEEVKTARRVMRDKFTHADMGVSGANVAVAETGTVFTMTNEGNGRMVGTLPSIHLYVFGIEKFVKSLSDARYIFKALPRNGTAQRITSYISMYTGACEVTTDKETDEKRKKDFYCVILDDPGRREILAEPDFREIFHCIRCGACLDVCPAFALVGGHVYGSNVYTGGIGTMLTHFLVSEERAAKIQNICLQCGRCNEVCGGGHDIAYGTYNGILSYAKTQSKNPKIGIISFDAHFDMREYDKGANSGTMFYQIADDCKKNGIKFDYNVIGIQRFSNTKRLFDRAKSFGVTYYLAEDILKLSDLNIKPILERNDYIHLTICTDVFHITCAPGVSAPQTFGIWPSQAIGLLNTIAKTKKNLTLEVAEISPRYDYDDRTSRLIANLIYQIILKHFDCEIN